MDSVVVAGFRVVARRDNDDGHNLWFGCSNTLLVGSSVHRVRLVLSWAFPIAKPELLSRSATMTYVGQSSR